jgi:hypothetical protein
MLHRIRTLLVPILLLASLWGPALAADMGESVGARPDDVAVATQRYLENRALLMMVRATFDVVDPDEIEADILAEARRIGTAGPSMEVMARLDRTLLSEADYFIVSLRYLVIVGSAVWPPHKPESIYANDTIVLLDQLEADLADALAANADVLPLLQRVQQLWLLSEGYDTVPTDRDMFARRDEIVSRALAAIPTRNGT